MTLSIGACLVEASDSIDHAVEASGQIHWNGQATEKLVPHPQPATALGFLIWKDWPIRSSTKSISAPPMWGAEM